MIVSIIMYKTNLDGSYNNVRLAKFIENEVMIKNIDIYEIIHKHGINISGYYKDIGIFKEWKKEVDWRKARIEFMKKVADVKKYQIKQNKLIIV